MRIWTYKNVNEKAHTFSKRSKNVKKRTKTYEKQILCKFTLSQKTKEANKLKQHLESCHGGLVEKIDYFWQKSEHLTKWLLEFGEMWVKHNKAVLKTLYHIAFCTAWAKSLKQLTFVIKNNHIFCAFILELRAIIVAVFLNEGN